VQEVFNTFTFMYFVSPFVFRFFVAFACALPPHSLSRVAFVFGVWLHFYVAASLFTCVSNLQYHEKKRTRSFICII
jgi:hypothetical protein